MQIAERFGVIRSSRWPGSRWPRPHSVEPVSTAIGGYTSKIGAAASSPPAPTRVCSDIGPAPVRDGTVLVDGQPWDDPGVAAAVAAIAGEGAQIVPSLEGVFDVLPLLVATDGAITAFGHDGRRLRPNLVIGGVPGLDERGWEGHRLRIGEVVIALADLRGRCVMTTYDPDLARIPTCSGRSSAASRAGSR